MGTRALHEVSVARRMSWASRRETKRVEDEAYCLMGIFDVHLPTIYGEGKEAFIRLQEEIMRRIPDATLFAWGPRADPVETMVGYRSVFPTSSGKAYMQCSCLLAESPAAFTECSDLISITKKVFAAAYDVSPHNASFTVTSHGIQATCPVMHFSGGCTLLLLPCCKIENHETLFVALILRFQGEGSPWGVGTRYLSEEVVQVIETWKPRRPTGRVESPMHMVKSRPYHRDVRCLLLPMGFDFTTCLQRPLKSPVQRLIPTWERSYIAYRLAHVLVKELPQNGVLGLQRQPSRSPYYKLFFPTWVTTRLKQSGFAIPSLTQDPAPGLRVGEQLNLSLLDWRHREQLRMELRTEIAPRSSGGDIQLAALWCAVMLPSDASLSLDAQVSAFHEEWDQGSSKSGGTVDSSMPEENMQGSSMRGLGDGLEEGSVSESTSRTSINEEEDIEVEAGYVDLWEHSGCKGCKEFFTGRWRLLLTFTRLCDSSGQDIVFDEVCNVYLVDIDVSWMASSM
ncbi:hypothetical protein BC628DRAFT_1391414 [Trametes gibbosa]|nr:hypothetical protein BC628DRAFT_1391414 [Trametes gibbosa]